MSVPLLALHGNKLLIIFVLSCFVFFSQACDRLLPSPLLAQTLLPSLTATPEECSWSGLAEAWNDSNGNGIREATEKPLSDIRFFLEDRLHNSERSDYGRTGTGGSMGIIILLPGCSEVQFEVYPEVPPNCQLTTPARILADHSKDHEEFLFGFLCH